MERDAWAALQPAPGVKNMPRNATDAKWNRGGSRATYAWAELLANPNHRSQQKGKGMGYNYNAAGNSGDYSYRSHQGERFDPGSNQALGRFTDAINKATQITGLDPELIGGMIWAETRGKPEVRDEADMNVDGHPDVGPMRISQNRWDTEVEPKLTEAQRASIKQATGKDAKDLKMDDDIEGTIGGSLEYLQKRNNAGSDEEALQDYVGDSNREYPGDVKSFQNTLENKGDLVD